ncbi:MAG: S8 family serine peptidase [Solirubrobacterales bacterium]
MSRLRSPFIFIAVLLGLLIPAGAQADPGSLSVRLDALAGKDLRNASAAEQADAVSLLPRGAGSLTRDGGRIVVQARTTGDPHASVPALRDAGADILDVYEPTHAITASVREQDLRAVGAVDDVEYLEEVIAPMSGAELDGADGHARKGGVVARANNTCATGTFVSEALTQLRANVARSLYDVDGTGVKVGILSDSYAKRVGPATTAAQDVAAGDLPGPGNPCGRTTPVQVLDDGSVFSKADEGRAMLQAVHDVAPGAALAFATAENSDSSFAGNIVDLANAGADVIADDYIYFNEPFYQDSVISKAVADVTSAGIPYFSMAYNNNRRLAGNDSNSWEAPAYRPTACPAIVNALPATDPVDCMDFNPGAPADNQFGITATAGGTSLRFDMQWAQPWFGVNTDFNIYVINVATSSVTASSTNDNVNTSKIPFEFAAFNPGSTAAFNYQVVIGRMAGTATPRIKWINSDNGAGSIAALEYPVSAGGDTVGPTIFGHNGSTSAQTVGAVPYNNAATVEDYSSRGPVTHLFGPVNGVTPAPALGSPQVTSKPDVVATDGGQNTFFGSNFGGGLFRFFGTSQASPHAAAVAALQIDAEPSITQQEVKQAQVSSAKSIPGFGQQVQGAGLIDAEGALIAGDETAPTLLISKKPPKTTKSTKAKFEFLTDHNADLACSLDDKRAKPCAAQSTFKVKPGKHRLIVQATDPADNLTAANYSWKVKKKKRK